MSSQIKGESFNFTTFKLCVQSLSSLVQKINTQPLQQKVPFYLKKILTTSTLICGMHQNKHVGFTLVSNQKILCTIAFIHLWIIRCHQDAYLGHDMSNRDDHVVAWAHKTSCFVNGNDVVMGPNMKKIFACYFIKQLWSRPWFLCHMQWAQCIVPHDLLLAITKL